MEDLKDQVVIVTGASAGIGEATVKRLAREGARVVLAARRMDRLQEIVKEIETGGVSGDCLLALAADVTSDEDRTRIVQETLRAYGRIDALINNAGYGQRGPVELVPLEQIRRNYETNLFSLIGLTQLVIPVMREQNRGRIVNIGSVAGRIARPMSSIYDSTKHALEAVTDGLRGELSPFGIKVILVQPGFIITEFLQVANENAQPLMDQPGPYAPFFAGLGQSYQRMRRLAGHPEDIAETIHKALTTAHPRARYAAPGHARQALALKKLLPERWFDYLLSRQMSPRKS